MSADEKPATDEEKRARVLAAKQRKEAAAASRQLDAQVERCDLVERFEKELSGPEGQAFAVLDMTHLGEGFFVVRLAPSIVWKNYWESKMTSVDEHDLVSACVVHPEKGAYLSARNKRQGIDVELGKLIGRLNGLRIGVEEGK